MRTRHVPLRTCVACRTKADKRDMVRVVRSPSGEVAPDPSGKAHGRGAYLCPRLECWEAGIKKNRLGHALRLEGSLSEEARNTLMAYARDHFAPGGPANNGNSGN